jgi:hypothetical protein
MKTFCKCIKIQGQNRCCDFDFHETYTPQGLRYFVWVDCKPHEPQTFAMKQRGYKWVIINAPLVPQWIHAVEEQLSDAIVSAA